VRVTYYSVLLRAYGSGVAACEVLIHVDLCLQLWRGELLRARQRRHTALRRALLYRWRTWRAYLTRYKATEVEDMDNELDRKLESLAKLQMLLQTHSGGTPAPSPKHAEPMSLSTGAGRSSKVALTRVSEGSIEGTEEALEAMGFDSAEANATGADSAAGLVVSTSARVESPKTSVSAKHSFVGPPPMSPSSQSRGSSGKFVRERSSLTPVLTRAPTAPTVPLTAREVKKMQEAKLAQRKQLLLQVDTSIRDTLSTFSLPGGEVSGYHRLLRCVFAAPSYATYS
jgi:hypothetical protein